MVPFVLMYPARLRTIGPDNFKLLAAAVINALYFRHDTAAVVAVRGAL